MTPPHVTVHQYHHSVQPHDAVTNHMLLIRDALREVGIGGKLLATEIKSRSLGAQAFSGNRAWDCDLLLIHHSQGNPVLPEVLKIEVPKALVYHNITPPEFFRHDKYLSRLCELGRKQLMTLRRHTKMSFAVSEFNAWELRTLGFGNPRSIPLLDIPRLGTPRRPQNRTGAPRMLLFVGKLTPHKNQSLLLKALFHLNLLEPEQWQLTLVGGEDPIYGRYLKGLATTLGIRSLVNFAGRISDDELSRAYLSHDAFLCVSRHEGFCVPVVEAMRHGLPVLAWPCTGVSETMGDAGLRIRTGKPQIIAEITRAALEDRKVLRHIAGSQTKRVAELAEKQNKNRLQAIFQELLPGLRGWQAQGDRHVEASL